MSVLFSPGFNLCLINKRKLITFSVSYLAMKMVKLSSTTTVATATKMVVMPSRKNLIQRHIIMKLVLLKYLFIS